MLKDIRQKPAGLSEIVLLMVHKEGGAYGIPEANCNSNVFGHLEMKLEMSWKREIAWDFERKRSRDGEIVRS